LGRQTARRVGLAPYEVVESGAGELREYFQTLRGDGVAVAVLDCLSDAHVETICRACADLRLLTGGSAFGAGLPAVWRERGWVEEFDRRAFDGRAQATPAATQGVGRLVVAGSCSAATRAQNRRMCDGGAPAFRVGPRELLEDDFGRAALVRSVRAQLAGGRDCLLTTTDEPAGVARAQEWAAGEGMDA